MKLAIKVLTEWDRENVIPFFEKYYPNCNKIMDWHLVDIGIGDLMWVDEVNDLRNNNEDIPSDYTILQEVPKDFELPNENKVDRLFEEFETKTEQLITKSQKKDLDGDLKSIIEFIKHIKDLKDNGKYGLAEDRFNQLTEQIKEYIGI